MSGPAIPPLGPGASPSQPLKPPPPVPTPRNTKGIGLVIAVLLAIPVCLVLACGSTANGMAGQMLYADYFACVETTCIAEGWLPNF